MHYQQAIELSKRRIAIRIVISENRKRVFARGDNGNCEVYFRGNIKKIPSSLCEGYLDWYPVEFIIHN